MRGAVLVISFDGGESPPSDDALVITPSRRLRGFVDFLRTELDRVGSAHADLCREFFSRAVALELSFFEAALGTAQAE